MADANLVTRPQSNKQEDLPDPTIELLDDEGFRLQIERLSEDALFDQGSVTFGGQGCVSTPSGPTC